MSFSDILGQDSAVNFLKASISSGKVSHAYIFAGPSGCGRKTAAINFAKALNCLDPKDFQSCDKCVQCRKIDSSSHPDVLLLSPGKEGASFGIDMVRKIAADIALKPYEAPKKVYILDDADNMTLQAANALLKTLEEPPRDCVLILISGSYGSVLPTIRSRAQLVRFLPLSVETVKRIITKSGNTDQDLADLAAGLCLGDLTMASRYCDKRFMEKRNKIIDALIKMNSLESSFDSYARVDLEAVMSIMLSWYRDILIAKAGLSKMPGIVNKDKESTISALAQKFSFDYICKAIDNIMATGSMLDQNMNAKVSMGVLGVSLMHQ